MRAWLSALVACMIASTSLADSVVYPRHQANQDPQLDYVLAVLRLALDKSGKSYELRQSDLMMVQSRAILEIKNNTGTVDLLWAMTTPEREAELLPIRIPIDRGLIGWRIALVKADRPQLFVNASTPSDLAHLTAGQMHDWPDTAILRSNGLRVMTSGSYEGLFQQLALGRIDYFPRSAFEIQSELAAHDALGLAIEPYLVFKYPAAFYFFVGKSRPALARDIETGLERAIADGSFNSLFQLHFKDVVEQLNLSRRRVVELENKSLPEGTPLSRKELWFQPPVIKK